MPHLTHSFPLVVALAVGASPLLATDLIKADNTSNLRTAGTYGAPNDLVATPTSSDRIIFNSVFANTTSTINSGGAVSILSLRVEDPGHDILLSLQNATMTLGTSGSSGSIDLSSAAKNLAIGNTGSSGVLRMRGSAPAITAKSGVTLTVNVPVSAFDGGTLTISGGGTTTLGGAITNGNGGVATKLACNGGTLVLSSSLNTFTGATTVSGGTLKLGSGSAIGISGTASVTVNGGALASAAGSSALGAGAVSMSSGAISPGDAGGIGSFTLAGDQSFTATGGTLYFDLSSGSSFDQIFGSGSGTFSISGTTLALSGPATSIAGGYRLFSGFASGGVNLLTITGVGAGYAGSLDNTGLLTISLVSVPEPSTCAFLAGLAGLAAATGARRRR